MWQGKKKAITFSFDDGVSQDLRTMQILDKYGLKATFNLNSGRFGIPFPYDVDGRHVERNVIEPAQVAQEYTNHEVAVHTVSHPNLTALSEPCIIWQVEKDREMLEGLTGKEIRCMAYPCGGVNNDDRVADVIKRGTKIRFARTITSTYSFDMQENLLRFNPTLHIIDGKLFDIAEQFLALETDEPKLFYIWGHTYEFDATEGAWERFERLCQMIEGKDDIFYGTNSEIFFEN